MLVIFSLLSFVAIVQCDLEATVVIAEAEGEKSALDVANFIINMGGTLNLAHPISKAWLLDPVTVPPYVSTNNGAATSGNGPATTVVGDSHDRTTAPHNIGSMPLQAKSSADVPAGGGGFSSLAIALLVTGLVLLLLGLTVFGYVVYKQRQSPITAADYDVPMTGAGADYTIGSYGSVSRISEPFSGSGSVVSEQYGSSPAPPDASLSHRYGSINLSILAIACVTCIGLSTDMSLPSTEAAFDTVTYKGCKILDPKTDFRFEWTVANNQFLLGRVSANVKGWAAIGFSTDGTMTSAGDDGFGSDIVLGWPSEKADACCVGDYSANAHKKPALDASQDVKAVSATQVGGRLQFEFERNLVTGDEAGDRDLTFGKVTQLIWAASDHRPASLESFGRHSHQPIRRGPSTDRFPIDLSLHKNECGGGSQRVRVHLKSDTYTTLKKDIVEKELAYHAGIDASRVSVNDVKDLGGTLDDLLKACADCGVWSHTIDNFRLSTEETQYMCFGAELPIKPGESFSIIGLETIIDNVEVNHHMTLVNGPNDFVKNGQGTPKTPLPCALMPATGGRTLWVSALGTPAFVFPPDTGFVVSYESRFVHITYHYDNVLHSPDQYDSSGFRILYSPTVVNNKIGVRTGSGGGQPNAVLPPHLPRYWWGAECPPVTTAKPLQLFAVWPHAHLLGRKIWITLHGPNGLFKGYVVRQLNYHFDSQNTWFLDPPMTIEPGDHLAINCQFNSTSRDFTSVFGPGTVNEMCTVAFYYYPDTPNVVLCGNTGPIQPKVCSFPCVDVLKPGWTVYGGLTTPPTANPFAPDVGTTMLDNGLMVFEGLAHTPAATWTASVNGKAAIGTVPFFRPQPQMRSIHLVEGHGRLMRVDVAHNRDVLLYNGDSSFAPAAGNIWLSLDNIMLDTAPAEEWIDIELQATWELWTPVGSYYPAQFHVTNDGFVTLRGLIKAVDWATTPLIGTLPPDARPLNDREFITLGYHTDTLYTTTLITVGANGEIRVGPSQSGTTWAVRSGGFVSLDDVHFFAQPQRDFLATADTAVVDRTRTVARNLYGVRLQPDVVARSSFEVAAVRVDRLVCLRGSVTVAASAFEPEKNQAFLGTLDIATRPSVIRLHTAASSTGRRRVDIYPDGSIRTYGPLDYKWITFDGLCWPNHKTNSIDLYYQ